MCSSLFPQELSVPRVLRTILTRLKLVADQADQLQADQMIRSALMGGGAQKSEAFMSAVAANVKRRQGFLFLIDSILNRIKQVRRIIPEYDWQLFFSPGRCMMGAHHLVWFGKNVSCWDIKIPSFI